MLAAAQSQGDLFSLTDNTAEDWGYTAGGDLLALNHFDTSGRTVLINQISVAWDSLSSLARPTLALYSDPDGDGAPNDMRPLGIFPVMVQPGIVILNQSFQDYPITPTLVTGSFFVGAFVSDRNPGNPCLIGVDTSSPHPGQSWIVENSNGPGLMNLQDPIGTSTLIAGLSRFVNGNHMIEAEYTIVPEPTGSLIFALGVLALTAHRARHPRV